MRPEEAKEIMIEALYHTNNPVSAEAINLAIQALEKQAAKKPIHANGNYYCPTCKDTWILWDDAIPNEHDNFCPSCGQKINWEENQ